MKKQHLLAMTGALSIAALSTPAMAETGPGGFYAGATLGYQTTDMDWKTDRTLEPNGNPIAPFSDTTESLDDSDASYGLFTGYNWVVGQGKWVLGAEFSAVKSDASDEIRNRIPGLGDPNSNPTSFSEVETDDLALGLSLRGGYMLHDNTMVYSSLGVSQLEVETTSTCPADTNVCNPSDGFQRFSDDERMNGWALGIGAEHFLSDNLVLRAEYRYADYGDFDFTAIPAQSGSSFGADATIEVVRQTLELGAAYKF